jgi:predicted N-acyltransferase
MHKCIVQGVYHHFMGSSCKNSTVFTGNSGPKKLSMAGNFSPDFQKKNKILSYTGHPADTAIPLNVRHSFFRTIESAGYDWERVAAQAGDVFLQRPYLQTLETAPPREMRFGYLLFYADSRPVGIAVCQIKRFSASESLADLNNTEKDPCFFNGIANWLKRRIAGSVDAEILVCGNLLVTGKHGFWFDPAIIAAERAPELLYEALQDGVAQIDRSGSKISMILIKDVLPGEQDVFGKYFIQKQFTEFDIQPNMVLHLDDYADFDGYLGAMTTKYRTRAKRAFKKREALHRRELTKNDILEAAPVMYALYKSVAKSAGFNVVDLNETYLSVLHKAIDGTFRVFGYYLEGAMVAYCTTLKNNEELEAHFIGYDKNLNHEYQLYLNMLYDMVGIAFSSGCRRVVFARTALEIKSSAGAVPEHLLCYLKHQNPLINNFTSSILDYLKPVEEWQQRHPFKHLQPQNSEESEQS